MPSPIYRFSPYAPDAAITLCCRVTLLMLRDADAYIFIADFTPRFDYDICRRH